MQTDKIFGDILIGLTIVFTVYLSAGMIHRIHTVTNKDTYRAVLRYEWCIAVVLAALSVDLRTGFFTKLPVIPVNVGWCLRIAFCFATAVVLALAGGAVCRGLVNNASSTDYVIILGMALENGKPNKDLLYRVKTAEAYAARHPGVKLIVTGGNPAENALSESEVMKRLLVSDGIDESRVITEDQAETTLENFVNVAKMIDPAKPIVIVTNNYHTGRAVNIAKRAGFTRVEQLPAPSDPYFYGINIMWEVIGELDTAIHWNRINPKREP